MYKMDKNKLKNLLCNSMLIFFAFTILLFSICLVNYKVERKIIIKAESAEILDCQNALRELGIYNGEINGIYNEETIKSLKIFQQNNGLTLTGVLDKVTAEALGVGTVVQSNSTLYLLAKLVHSEARGEPYVGQVAVAAVVLNRVKSPDFPNTLAGVIYQPWAFTAVNDGQINLEPVEVSYQAAQDALNGWDPSYGCVFYYNPAKATSQWIFSRTTVVTIGSHIFAL